MINVVCLDIDGVLCEERGDDHNYLDRTPQSNALEIIKKLQKKNLFFSYYTARPEIDRIQTAKWLQKHHFPAAPLIMGKPQADIYVDDRSVSSLEQLLARVNREETS